MRLLFLDGASMCHYDTEGNLYIDTNMNMAVMERYRRLCDELAVIAMRDEKTYSVEEAKSKFDSVDRSLVEVVAGPSLYRPRTNLFSLRIRREIKEIVSREVQKADRVIIRAPGRYYSDTALKMCRKWSKLYLVEAVEFAYEFRRYGKIYVRPFAPYAEFMYKKGIANAPYVVYVTQHALQERYPTNGKSLGCSDVELQELDASILEKRTKRETGASVIFGTAGALGGYKGQEYVIQAIAELKCRGGITNIEYHLAGKTTRKFEALINELGLQEQIKLYGQIPHWKIFDWYDHLDVYIQPSFQEGLCRSIVEAMSRALPVVCSDIGGNPELASTNMMFHPGNVEQIAEVMKKLLDPKVRRLESERSFTKAGEFAKSRLDPIRNKFYMDFMHS